MSSLTVCHMFTVHRDIHLELPHQSDARFPPRLGVVSLLLSLTSLFGLGLDPQKRRIDRARPSPIVIRLAPAAPAILQATNGLEIGTIHPIDVFALTRRPGRSLSLYPTLLACLRGLECFPSPHQRSPRMKDMRHFGNRPFQSGGDWCPPTSASTGDWRQS